MVGLSKGYADDKLRMLICGTKSAALGGAFWGMLVMRHSKKIEVNNTNSIIWEKN